MSRDEKLSEINFCRKCQENLRTFRRMMTIRLINAHQKQQFRNLNNLETIKCQIDVFFLKKPHC